MDVAFTIPVWVFWALGGTLCVVAGMALMGWLIHRAFKRGAMGPRF